MLSFDIINNQIEDLQIDYRYRNKGYARRLTDKAIKDYGHNKLCLWAEADNDDYSGELPGLGQKDLEKFYRSFGFKSRCGRYFERPPSKKE